MAEKIYKIKEFWPYPIGPYTTYMSPCDCGKTAGSCNCPIKGGRSSHADTIQENVIKK